VLPDFPESQSAILSMYPRLKNGSGNRSIQPRHRTSTHPASITMTPRVLLLLLATALSAL
jgi:hypothetical protein